MWLHDNLITVDLISCKTFLPFCFPLWCQLKSVQYCPVIVHCWLIANVNKIHQAITQCCSCVKLHDTNVTLKKSAKPQLYVHGHSKCTFFTLRKVQKILPLVLRSENLFSNLKSYFHPPYWISFEKTRCFCDILKAKMSENSDSMNPQSRVSNEGSNK